MSNLDDKIAIVRDAIEAQNGRNTTWEIAEGIINVYGKPVPPEGPDGMEDDYLVTVTVTVTP